MTSVMTTVMAIRPVLDGTSSFHRLVSLSISISSFPFISVCARTPCPMTTIYREYQIPLPFTTTDYRIAQLYTVAQMSIKETTGDTSISIVENKDIYDDEYGHCRYTEKVFYLNSKVPTAIRAVVPKRALIVEEKAYNAYPTCHTYYTNRAFDQKTFSASVVSTHIDNDLHVINACKIDQETYAKTKIKRMDICSTVINKEYDCTRQPLSINNGRPLTANWFVDPPFDMMVCYKFVTITFNCFGLGWLVYEIEKQVDSIFMDSHQRMVCTMDEWYGKDMNDIRRIEDGVRERLNKKKGEEMNE